MDNDERKAWEQFLDPDVTRPRLIAASIYIAAFELLKDAIVNRLRGFYSSSTNEQERQRYETEVLEKRKRSLIYASLDWLKEAGAVDSADVETFERVKACRNQLAHELLQVFASSGLPDGFEDRFADMINLLKKIEVWWIHEVETPSGAEPSPGVESGGVAPGSLLTLQILCHVALGSDEDSRRYLEAFTKKGHHE